MHNSQHFYLVKKSSRYLYYNQSYQFFTHGTSWFRNGVILSRSLTMFTYTCNFVFEKVTIVCFMLVFLYFYVGFVVLLIHIFKMNKWCQIVFNELSFHADIYILYTINFFIFISATAWHYIYVHISHFSFTYYSTFNFLVCVHQCTSGKQAYHTVYNPS